MVITIEQEELKFIPMNLLQMYLRKLKHNSLGL